MEVCAKMMDFCDMTIEELVETYHIVRHDDALRIYRIPKEHGEALLEHIRAVRPALMEYLLEKERSKKQAAQDLAAKIKAIPGLLEIRNAQADLRAWHRELNASFEGDAACGGMGVRPKPTHDLDALRKQYPKAAAYLKADEWSKAENYAKRTAGQSAAHKILAGEDYNLAISEMEEKWSAYCVEHMWD